MLAEQVRKHLDTEDATLLTAIEDLIDDDTLIELGRRMEQRDRVIEARRELATVVPAPPQPPPGRRHLGGLVAVGTAALAVLARRRRPTLIAPPPAGGASAAADQRPPPTLHYGPEEWPSGRRQRP